MMGYELVERRTANYLRFYFISSGRRNVTKIIDIAYIEKYKKYVLCNLGFGDYDFNTTEVNDSSNTANNDGSKVFNTVLNAIQRFFELYPSSMLIIQDSDSNSELKENCKISCRRKCSSECRKFNQRKRIYRYYLDRHFEDLKIEYDFFGEYTNQRKIVLREAYVPGKNYDLILIHKRIGIINSNNGKTDGCLSDADKSLILSVAIKIEGKIVFPERFKAAKEFINRLKTDVDFMNYLDKRITKS